jgi:hypothetical protein
LFFNFVFEYLVAWLPLGTATGLPELTVTNFVREIHQERLNEEGGFGVSSGTESKKVSFHESSLPNAQHMLITSAVFFFFPISRYYAISIRPFRRCFRPMLFYL